MDNHMYYSTEEEQKQKSYLGITINELREMRHSNPAKFKQRLVELANTVFAGDEEVRALTLRAMNKI